MGVLERTSPANGFSQGANPDWTIPQGFERYSEAEHRTWTTLYERQAEYCRGAPATHFCMGSTRSICTAMASPIFGN